MRTMHCFSSSQNYNAQFTPNSIFSANSSQVSPNFLDILAYDRVIFGSLDLSFATVVSRHTVDQFVSTSDIQLEGWPFKSLPPSCSQGESSYVLVASCYRNQVKFCPCSLQTGFLQGSQRSGKKRSDACTCPSESQTPPPRTLPTNFLISCHFSTNQRAPEVKSKVNKKQV